MLALMERAGDSAINDLWHSVVQLVTNNPPLHAYAARKCAEALARGASFEVFLKCTGYVLGEYGRLLSAGGEVPLLEQFRLLQQRFVAASPETKVGRAAGTVWAAAGYQGDSCRGGGREASSFLPHPSLNSNLLPLLHPLHPWAPLPPCRRCC